MRINIRDKIVFFRKVVVERFRNPIGKIETRDVPEAVDHPSHYGGVDNPCEAIKVIEAWNLNFNLGNTVKYISRAGKKGSLVEDLKKALWYLAHEISNLEKIK